tara:strand:- start:350 stop:466 length:117 start_codon:yes stop_codon:yes gene_type:complete
MPPRTDKIIGYVELLQIIKGAGIKKREIKNLATLSALF